MAEYQVLGCGLRVRRMIVVKNTLVYWGEEKESGGRSLVEECTWIGDARDCYG